MESLFKCRMISSSSSLLYKNFEKNLKSSTFFILAEMDITLAEKDMYFGRNGMTVSAKKGHFGLCCPGRNDHLPCCTAKFLNNSTIFKVFNVSYLNRGAVKKKDVGRSFQENNQCLKYEVLRSSLLLISLRRMRVYAQHPFKTSHRIIIRFLAMVVCGAI